MGVSDWCSVVWVIVDVAVVGGNMDVAVAGAIVVMLVLVVASELVDGVDSDGDDCECGDGE